MADENKGSKNPYAFLEPVIINQLVKPIIDEIIDEGADSKSAVLEKIRERAGHPISAAYLDRWLDILGYKFTRVVQVQRPVTEQPAEPDPGPLDEPGKGIDPQFTGERGRLPLGTAPGVGGLGGPMT